MTNEELGGFTQDEHDAMVNIMRNTVRHHVDIIQTAQKRLNPSIQKSDEVEVINILIQVMNGAVSMLIHEHGYQITGAIFNKAVDNLRQQYIEAAHEAKMREVLEGSGIGELLKAAGIDVQVIKL